MMIPRFLAEYLGMLTQSFRNQRGKLFSYVEKVGLNIRSQLNSKLSVSRINGHGSHYQEVLKKVADLYILYLGRKRKQLWNSIIFLIMHPK